ncbi:MAG: hypothetical protein JNM00_11850 [Flavobacteriales bacterium]|nr:hypothetical protein [Flavobacteriales bacterium]
MHVLRTLSIFCLICILSGAACMAILLVKEGMDFSDPTDEDFVIPATIIVVGLCQILYWSHSRRYLGLREWHRWSDTLDNFLANQDDLKQSPIYIPWRYKVPGIIGSLGLAGFIIIWIIALVEDGGVSASPPQRKA